MNPVVLGDAYGPPSSTTEEDALDPAASYSLFLDHKTHYGEASGFEPSALPDFLFPFQRALVSWALAQGRAAIFADCGLGKTPMQLVWANEVARYTGKPVLILTPLAVSYQTEREAEKFGVDAKTSRDGSVSAPIVITNYDRLHYFDRAVFGGCVCDESSAIKAYDGKRRAEITDFMRKLPYRLLCTATAAPNDYVELGTSSEALGELGYMDMLTRFFINKEKTIQGRKGYDKLSAKKAWEPKTWRFKGHAEEPFWRWVAGWARALRKPSDLGYNDELFQLPALEHRQHVIRAHVPREGSLFDMPANGLREEREEQRRTIAERCEMAGDLVKDEESAVVWCQLNAEGDLLEKLIPDAIQVSGSDNPEDKEEKLVAFTRGEARVLITKPIIGAWGLNWQHCNRMVFFPSHSYEQYYQAVRRSWRFGQKRPVLVDVVTTEGGTNALESIERKSEQAEAMFAALVAHMQDALAIEKQTYNERVEVPSWL